MIGRVAVLLCLIASLSTGLAAQSGPDDPVRYLGLPEPSESVTSVGADAVYPCDGTVFVAWSEDRGDGEGFRLIARSFFRDGVPATGRLVVAEGVDGLGIEPRVFRLGTERPAVAWLSDDDRGTVRVARLRSDGSGFEPSQVVMTGVAGREYWVLDTPPAGGSSFSIVSRDRRGRLLLNRFSTALRPLGGPYVLGGREKTQVDVEPGDGPFFYLAWSEDRGGRQGRDVYLETIDLGGLQASLPVRVNTRLTGDQQQPSIAVAGDTLIIAWSGPGATDESDVYARRFSTLLAPDGPEVWIDRGKPWLGFGDESNTHPDVAITTAGGVVITWLQEALDDSLDGPLIVADLLGPNLDQRSRHFGIVPFGLPGFHDPPKVTSSVCDGEGDATIAWTARFFDSDLPAAGMRQFSALSTGRLEFDPGGFNVFESDSTATVAVNRTPDGLGAASVRYSVASGTAQAGSDFIPTTGLLSWADGELGPKSFDVELIQDGNAEASEFANVVLFDATGGVEVPDFERRLFIHEIAAGDPGRPQIAAGQTGVVESAGVYDIVVERLDGATGPLSFDWIVINDGGVELGVDVLTTGGTVSWPAGDRTPQVMTLQLRDNQLVQGDRRFLIALWPPGEVGQGAPVELRGFTLFDDDPSEAGTIEFVEPHMTSGESNGPIRLWVERRDGSAGATTAEYWVGYTGDDLLGLPAVEQLHWSDGDSTPRAIELAPLWDDEEPVRMEPDRVRAELIRVISGTARLGAARVAEVSIVDDDEVLFGPTIRLVDPEPTCTLGRLSTLAGRTDLLPGVSGRPCWLNLSTTETGDPFAAAQCRDEEGLPVLLSFSLNGEESTLLSNPARPQLTTFSATRNRVASDLVEPGSEDALVIEIDPTGDPSATAPAELIRIDNLESGVAASAKPGRFFSQVTTSCHEQTARDAHTMAVLSRLIEPLDDGATRHSIAIYRGRDPLHYWIELVPFEPSGGLLPRSAFSAVVGVDPITGNLDRLWLSAPFCLEGGNGCGEVANRSGITLVEPVRGGVEATTRIGPIRFEPGRVVEVDLGSLLENTTWAAFP